MKNTVFRFDRSLINPKGDSVRYLEVSMEAPIPSRGSKPQQPPLDLALVIDRSGSMSGAPLAAARDAARGVAEKLRPRDTLSVVVFDDNVDVLFEGLPMNKAGKRRADDMLCGVHSGGMTCLSEGWLKGAETVARLRENGRRSQVILLSDGHANQGILDPSELAHHAAALRERGVYTTCVGIGDGYSPEQLAVLSEHGGGQLHDAERPHEIIEVLLGELGELAKTYAEDVTIEIDMPSRVKAHCVGDLPTEKTSRGIRCHLGSIVEGRERHVILRLRCPRGEPEKTLRFKGRITFTRPGKDSEKVAKLKPVSLQFAGPSDSLRKQERDESLCLKVARVWHAEVVRNASRMNRDGAYREASLMIRTELAFFRRYCRGIPGTERLIEELFMLEDRVLREISERGRKEMHNYAMMERYSKPEHRHESRENWSCYLGRE